jgi:hypothetical protein
MNDFFDELESQLAGAARASARRRLRLPRWIGVVPALAAVGVAVVVVVLALTLLHHGHPATAAATGPAQRGYLPAEVKYLREAARHVPECHAGKGPVLPATSDGSPGPELLSLLAVLRRPATAADQLPRSLHAGAETQGIYVHYIRLARVSDGMSYYIVPAESVARKVFIPARCYAAIIAAVRAELPQIPAKYRAPTLDLAERIVARDRLAARARTGPGVCLLMTGNAGTAGTCGATAAQLTSVGLVSFSGSVSGVVPDGVATVTLRYPDGGGRHPKTVTASVVGNVFASATTMELRLPSPSMIWRSSTGAVLKTIPSGARMAGSTGFCSGPPSVRGPARRRGRSSFC